MHTHSFDLSIEEITKIEGAATLSVKVRNSQVLECNFSISEYKRFYTQAVRKKPAVAVPQLVARICGTCSNAHLLCSINAIENAFDIHVTPQTQLLRQLLNYGLIIRDHALHLYVFVLPDLFAKNSILEFDENIPQEHKWLDDCFAVKAAGNELGIAAGGRSVHAPFATLGGFLKIPPHEDLFKVQKKLKDVRPKVIDLIELFHLRTKTLVQEVKYVSVVDDDYTFLDGVIKTSSGQTIPKTEIGSHLNKVDIPHSHASGYYFDGKVHFVGALSRININKSNLHSRTKHDAETALIHFPSQNIYHNNLAQAIEILHAIDKSLDLIQQYQALPEKPISYKAKKSTGVGVIEAPRGMLHHKYEISESGTIETVEIAVPTGQNQIGIEHSLRSYLSTHLDTPKEEMSRDFEEIIRAYDPCMSCATHFLKVKWK